MTKNLARREPVEYVQNKSIGFFLPMIGESRFADFPNLKGVFIWCEEYPELDNHIFVLLRKSEVSQYRENLFRLTTFSNFIFKYSPDNFHEMLVFTPSPQFETDYSILKESKYSQISEICKRRILQFHNIRNNAPSEGKSMYSVLYRKEEYKNELERDLDVYIPEDLELASLLNPERETYLDEMKVVTNINNLDLM